MKTVAALSAVIALANAHATWQQLWKNGEDLESTCARLPASNSPIQDYTSNALQCNVNPAAASGKCSFAAGDTVTIEMHQQPNDRSCTNEGLGGAHWGPVLAYMGKVDDAAKADGSGEFFKVYQNTWAKAPGSTQGDNDFWGTKDLNYNCGKLDFTIPKDIAPGDYLLRAEAIALHAASASGGAQHYVTCYQLTVTGSGTLAPKGVTFPSAYTATGPGLGFSIHAPLDSYPAPGPELISSGTNATPQLLTFGTITGTPAAGTGASKPASSSQVAAVASSTTVVTPASSSQVVAVLSSAAVVAPASSSAVAEAVTTPVVSQVVSSPPFPIGNTTTTPTATGAPTLPAVSSIYESASVRLPSTFATLVRPQPTEGASTGPIKEYYQCGGSNFKGASTCAEGLVCKVWNPYYSQCVQAEATQPGPSKGPMTSFAPAQPTPTKVAAAPSVVASAAAEAAEPTTTKVVAAPSSAAPSAVASVAAKPSSAAPAGSESAERTFTLETFIAFLEEKSDSASAAKMRRMIEALM